MMNGSPPDVAKYISGKLGMATIERDGVTLTLPIGGIMITVLDRHVALTHDKRQDATTPLRFPKSVHGIENMLQHVTCLIKQLA